MHRKHRSAGTATAVAIVLVGLGLAAGWLAIAPAIYGGNANAYNATVASQPAPDAYAPSDVAPLRSGQALAGNLQTSQPRDPFRPLISAASSLAPGNGGRGSILFKVESIVLLEDDYVVNVLLNGVSYSVGVGDIFAGSYKVISITPPTEGLDDGSAVFLFGDRAFEVVVGQELLK